MTATSLGLNGEPVKFLGAFVKSISTNLGLSTSPSTASLTLVEDESNKFEFPEVGTFHTVTAGETWTFSGIITRYEIDVANISGRTIRVSMADPREIMKTAPVILAPGSEAIIQEIATTQCSVIDVYGAYNELGINLSGWNQSGMEFQRIASALNGDNILFGETVVPVFQQFLRAFGEVYEFNIDEVSNRVDPVHRVNTNLTPLSNIIEDLSSKNAFDWFVESERTSTNRIKVTVRIIDRSRDNIDVGLQEFLDLHEDKVITATSGIELRNDIACMALQGALLEQMKKVSILGLANEPIDLSVEGGFNNYNMEEDEIRVILAGRQSWEIWLGQQRDYDEVAVVQTTLVKDEDTGRVTIAGTKDIVIKVSRGGFSRYGPGFLDDDINEIAALQNMSAAAGLNLGVDPNRKNYLVIESRRETVGKVLKKLEAHAKASYGKRFVHDAILDEVIQSAWTRGVVAGNDDPNEYFRQKDGKTKAYVEFSLEDQGGAFSLGLKNLTNLFGDQNIFKNITKFGTTFENRSSLEDSVLVLELNNIFDPNNVKIDIKDTANYIYKEAAAIQGSFKTSLYVSCTVTKDGVVILPDGVFEAQPTAKQLLQNAIATAQAGTKKKGVKTDTVEELKKAIKKVKRRLGNHLWDMHAKAYQPDFAYIPTKSRFLRYGPVFSDKLDGSAQGQLKIIQDDGFAPWEFGGFQLMLASMQLKVNNATSLQREAFSASINVEGYPLFSVGASIEKNSNINSITMSFGDGGVKTSYGLKTYTRKFGELSKEDWARIAFILNNGGGRVLPQQLTLFAADHNVNVDKIHGGGYLSSPDNVSGGALDFG